MSESPLVTVTVCARDGAHWVEDCLDAIFAQTHRPLEIIAVNDGSNDSTGLLMDQWQQSKQILTLQFPLFIKMPLAFQQVEWRH